MGHAENQDLSGVLNAFLNRYLDDSSRGEPAPLESYLAAFPGFEDIIRHKYAELRGAAAAFVSGTRTDGLDAPAPGAPDVDSLREIGSYRLIECLGEGGMGSVFLAEQIEPIRRRVALKLIKLGMSTKEVIARFEAERQALAVMDHPSIARVFDAGHSPDGRPYFVMEYVDGVPITAYCDQNRLRIAERLELFADLADGIQHAHQRGIIHRDLKPGNVLVTEIDGRPVPKIIDFGIAKSLHQPLTESTLLTHFGQVIGTPLYMSPEQFATGFADIDTRTDIYSLGVILYELVAGTTPIDPAALRRARLDEIERAIVETPTPRPAIRVAGLGPALAEVAKRRKLDPHSLVRSMCGEVEWIPMKALEKDRGRRYASASELAADVRRFLRGEPVLAGPPSWTYRLRKAVYQHRVGWSIALGALILLALSLGISASLERVARRNQSREFFDRGRLAWDEAVRFQDERAELEERWLAERNQLEHWEPIWRRAREESLWLELEDHRRAVEESYSEALTSLYKAYEAAPPGSEEHRRAYREIRRLHSPESRARVLGGELRLPPELFTILLGDPGFAQIDREFDGPFPLRIATDPAGAGVFCFRYEMREGRLFPLPFALDGGLPEPRGHLEREAFLEVESMWDGSGRDTQVFLPGDRLIEIDGEPVHFLRDLFRMLEAAPANAPVSVKLERSGLEATVRWRPFSETPKWEEIESTREALGLTFRGYPLDFSSATALGTTPLETYLPKGSYLLILRRQGFRDVRLPVVVPPPPGDEVKPHLVRLFAETELPPGFVYVPPGTFTSGGDRAVHQSLELAHHDIDGFFISRFETTVEEYADFLNSPENIERIDDAGRAPPLASWAADRLREFDEELVELVPESRASNTLLYEKRDGRWTPTKGFKDAKWPVLGVNALAAAEYANWLTLRHGGRWKFRLPTDLEWEKAARGVDARFYVWGDYPVWSFSRSALGTRGRGSSPDVVGAYPMDESVYGVRDMAGSASEPTSDITTDEYRSVRGGNWYAVDHYFFRIANRNGSWPVAKKKIDQGIRVVAELPPDE